MNKPFRAYSGDQPYVFVSYAHEDANAVFPEMQWLHDQGFNVWYDEGISPGAVWRTELADSIMGAGLFLFFVTPRSAVSHNCEKEVNFAIDHEIPVLTVHLEPTKLPSGLELTLSSIQGILKRDLADQDYREKLLTAVSNHMRRGISAAAPVAPDKNRKIAIVLGVVIAGLLVANLVSIFQQTDAPVETIADEQSLRRFTIDLPKTMQFTGPGFRPVTISSDGRRVIFHAVVEGRPQLYLRSLDSLNVLPIKGTEDAHVVHVVSPDGKWIAFVDEKDKTLKKIPITGGVPSVLCDLGGYVWDNIAWGANDNIVFTSSARPGLMQVSSSGGRPEPLTFPENGEFHKHAEFLADGSTLFFTIGERGVTARQSDRVAVLSLQSGEQKILMAGASPKSTPGGHLIYYKENALWSAAFDAERLEITSESVPVAEDVQYRAIAHYSISGDGSLVYVLDATFVDRPLVWVDRSGNEEPISIEPRPFVFPSLSPDGNQLSVTVDDKNGPELWLYSLSRGTSKRMTFDESRETPAVWDPFGRYIYYSSNLSDDLFRIDVDRPGEFEQLTETITGQYANSITPDGGQLIYEELLGSTGKDLAVLTLTDPPTSRYLLHTEFNELQARLSPDGRWLAYTSDQSGQREIYVRPFPNVDSAIWQISSGGGSDSVWAKNGNEIFYWGPTEIMAVAIETEPEFKSGLPEPMFKHQDIYEDSGITAFDVDPEGERFLMIKTPSEDSTLTDRIIVVENWLDEVARKIDPI